MIPDPKRTDLEWFTKIHNYETSQNYVFNVTRRSISLADILKDTRKWLKKSGLLDEKPFYTI